MSANKVSVQVKMFAFETYEVFKTRSPGSIVEITILNTSVTIKAGILDKH